MIRIIVVRRTNRVVIKDCVVWSMCLMFSLFVFLNICRVQTKPTTHNLMHYLSIFSGTLCSLYRRWSFILYFLLFTRVLRFLLHRVLSLRQVIILNRILIYYLFSRLMIFECSSWLLSYSNRLIKWLDRIILCLLHSYRLLFLVFFSRSDLRYIDVKSVRSLL